MAQDQAYGLGKVKGMPVPVQKQMERKKNPGSRPGVNKVACSSCNTVLIQLSSNTIVYIMSSQHTYEDMLS